MRIHTDMPHEVEDAIRRECVLLPGVRAYVTKHGSRSRKGALELAVRAKKRKGRRPHNGYVNDPEGEYGATWDEWGAVFAAIFRTDPSAKCPAYDGEEHYHWVTGGRFRDGMPEDTHDRHRFKAEGFAVGGAYVVHGCECGAIRRHMMHGRDFAEISGAMA